MIIKTKYRVVKYSNEKFKVQIWRWYFPFFIYLPPMGYYTLKESAIYAISVHSRTKKIIKKEIVYQKNLHK